MRVLVIGAAGFIGSHLVSALLKRGRLVNRAGELEPIEEIVLADAAPPVYPAVAPAIRAEVGDFTDLAFVQRLFHDRVDSVFPLAATLTAEAEANFAQGLRVNVLAFLQMLEACREQGTSPRLVFASSVAAFGGMLPDVVDDSVAQTPQTSYGTHKAITELLINDYSRHGFIDGRALRLPIVLIRPGTPSPTVSDRVAAIVREPLQGRDVVCPFGPQTRLPVASARRVAQCLITLHDLPANAFGDSRAMNLPALTVTVQEMIGSLERFRDTRRVGRVSFAPEAWMQAIVDQWPKQFVSARATRYGIGADASFDEIVGAFLEDYPPL
ncbi:MAG: D-erythronate dehydrogenase [Sulfurifustis sp.]